MVARPPPRPAQAQLAAVVRGGSKQTTPLDRNQPVAFTADNFDYDRTAGIVTATGHVEAWQNDHVLRADKVTFDRNTNVAAASGNVVIVEPDGQVLFADYAELTQGMREGVLKDMRALLAENGKLAANGARRTDGKVNELTHAVYTTCNLCKTDPSKPPLWQIRALTADAGPGEPADRIPRRHHRPARRPGRLPAVPVAPRPVGAPGERLPGAVLGRARISGRSWRRRISGRSTPTRT